MDELLLSISVIGLFILRIGVPMLILVGLGIALDRWQSRREKQQAAPYVESHNPANR